MSTYTPEQRLTDHTVKTANTRASLERSGLNIHSCSSIGFPALYWTVEGFNEQGALIGTAWCEAPVTANRTEHWLSGTYRMANSGYTWPKNTRQEHPGPTACMSGYPGLCRLDGRDVTDKSRLQIEQWVGAAIAHDLAHPQRRAAIEAEARDNQRELAAQELDRKARYEYDRAARILKTVGQYEARAAEVRAGADYDPKQPDRGIHAERH